MNILVIFLVLVAIGLLYMALQNIPGLPAWVKQLFIVLALVLTAVWLLSLAGVSPVIHIR